MKKSFRKKIFITCLISSGIISLSSINKMNYNNSVNNHVEKSSNHSGNIIAHRGFSSCELENSLPAIEKGMNSDCCDGVEIDVRFTKDENIIISHGSKIDGKKIEQEDLDELSKKYKKNKTKFNIYKDLIFNKDGLLAFERYKSKKNKKEKYISLDYLINNIDINKCLLIDIKVPRNNKNSFMKKLNTIFNCYKGDIIFQSNDQEYLTEMKKKYPSYNYQIIVNRRSALNNAIENFDKIALRKNLVSYELIRNILELDKQVSIWTINSYSDYKFLEKSVKEYLEDIFIITDYPDEMCYLINKDNKKLTYK